METVIIVIHLLIVVALVVVVLLQRSEGGALGIGGGGGGFMTGRGTANVLTRATAILAVGFFATSLVLAVLAGRTVLGPRSIFDTVPAGGAVQPQGATPPASGEGTGQGGILDTLRGMQQPQAPAVPQSGSQAPTAPNSGSQIPIPPQTTAPAAPQTQAPAAPAPQSTTPAPQTDAPAATPDAASPPAQDSAPAAPQGQ